MSKFEHAIEKIVVALEYLVTFLMAALFIEVLLVIGTRQVGLFWTWLYDVTRWTLAWLVFVGAVPLAARGAHLSVDVAVGALPAWARSLSSLLTAFCIMGVAGVVGYYGALEVFRMYEYDERSMSGALPAYLGYGVLPIAFALLAAAGLIRFIRPNSVPPNTNQPHA